MSVGKAIANASTPATEKTTIRIVSEIDWNVRSRQSATTSPIAPPATPDDAVTAKRVTTWPNEIPPKSMQSASSPAPAARRGQDVQQRGEELAEDDLQVAQVGHQQQDERPPVLLVGDRRGREQRGEEQDQGQLEEGEHPVEDAAEPGDHAELVDVAPADQRLPGRPHQDEQDPDVRRPHDVEPDRPGGGQHLPGDDRASEQGKLLRDRIEGETGRPRNSEQEDRTAPSPESRSRDRRPEIGTSAHHLADRGPPPKCRPGRC